MATRNQPTKSDEQARVDAQLKEQKKDDTIEVPASDAPNSPAAEASEEVVALQAELEQARTELAEAQAALAAAKSVTAEPVEVELESGAPKWVQRVSGMDRKDIAGYAVLNADVAGTYVLVVKDRDGREGHRFTFTDRQRGE